MVSGAMVSGACRNDETIRSEPITLTPGEWTAVASDAMRVKGPQSEVCATLPSDYQFSDTGWYLIAPNAHQITLRARLVLEQGNAR